MRKTRDLIYDIILVLFDFLAVVTAYVMAYAVRARLFEKPLAHPYGFELYLEAIIRYLPFWIIIFALSGLYRNQGVRSKLTKFSQIVFAVAGGSMLLILVDYYSTTPLFPSKAIAIYGFTFSLLLVFLGREVLRAIRTALARHGIGSRRVALVGDSDATAKRVAHVLEQEGTEIVALVAENKWYPRAKHFRNVASFVKQIDKLNLDDVVQVDPKLGATDHLDLVKSSHAARVNFRQVPNIVGLATAHQDLGSIDGVPVIEIKPTPLDGWGRIIKRSFDFVASLLGVIILMPFFVVIAALIKFTDPGGVFYKQERLSRNKKPVRIVKFRTMKAKYSGRSPEDVFREMGKPELIAEFRKENKLANDPRVSRIGRFLRRTSIDELPQLFNVVTGDLSLVGPRPMLASELDRYGDTLSSIFSIKSGITGLWQVSGRSDIGFQGRVRLDLYYIENWSLLMDLKIIARTALVMLKPRGAY